MRRQYTLKQATVDALTSRADALDIPVSRLLEHVVTEWLTMGGPVVLRPAATVQPIAPQQTAPRTTAAAPPMPTHSPEGYEYMSADEEDVDRCKDCDALFPFSHFSEDGKVHLNCPNVGAGLLALRRAREAGQPKP